MKLALIGDSHTQIVWPLLKPILEKSGYTVVSQQSQAGWGAKNYVSTGEVETVKRSGADVVIVGLGGNNHNLTDDYQATVDQFLKGLGRGKTIVWLGPYSSDLQTAASTAQRHEWTSNYLQRYLPSQGVVWVDTRSLSKTGHRSDGVHFPRSEYQRIVEGLKSPILEGLKGNQLILYMRKSLPVIMIISSIAGLAVWAYVTWNDKKQG